MLTREETERYLRHILLHEVGAQGQMKLRAARVLVVGAGGIGAPAIQALAGAGVGDIAIVDPDVVDLSNLQRQTIYTPEDVGAPKAAAAARFASRLNGDVRFIPHEEPFSADRAAALIAGRDIVVEGVDSFAARYVVNAACIAARVPLVSGAVGRFDGQIAVFDPTRAPGVLPCYRCFAPDAPLEGEGLCAEAGVLGPVPGVIGMLAAMEVLKLILGIGEPLRGRILIYDALNAATRTIALRADPACPDCSVNAQRRPRP